MRRKPASANLPGRDELTYKIIGCAINVHRVLGAGLLESAYDQCLCSALSTAGLKYVRQVHLPAVFDGEELEKAFRPDLIVERTVIVEIKAVQQLLPVHDSQMLTYLRFAELELGLLMNFNVQRMITGVRRLILSRDA